MTPTQEAIFDRWLKGEGAWKVFSSHSPLACNNGQIGVGNAEAHKGVKLSEIYWGGMGEANLSDGSDGDKAAALRHKIATAVMSGPIKLVLCGHSHMDGIYELYKGAHSGKICVRMVAPLPAPWGGELAFPFPDVNKKVVVTNSGGPLGEISEVWGTRRSRPAGATFAFDGRTITHTHVPASGETTRPRRCVYDSENHRIPANKIELKDLRVADGASRPPQVDGLFEYLKDRVDPSLDTVARLALVVCDDAGFFGTTEVSRVICTKVEMRDTHVVLAGLRTPELVGFMRMEFSLSRKILKAAVHASQVGAGRVYVVLQYNDKREDDWVIEVTVSRAYEPLDPTPRGEAVTRVTYTLEMIELPVFDAIARFKPR
jgi:hypothetical protein